MGSPACITEVDSISHSPVLGGNDPEKGVRYFLNGTQKESSEESVGGSPLAAFDGQGMRHGS